MVYQVYSRRIQMNLHETFFVLKVDNVFNFIERLKDILENNLIRVGLQKQ